MKLTVFELKQVFLNVIDEKISFEDASNWAFEMFELEDEEKLEYEDQDSQKIFEGLSFLHGLDLLVKPDSYLHSMKDVQIKFAKIFI
jgi:hypothetical protein